MLGKKINDGEIKKSIITIYEVKHVMLRKLVEVVKKHLKWNKTKFFYTDYVLFNSKKNNIICSF